MKPPACVSCKWGQGTACEKPSNTAAAKEMEAKLKQMLAERSKQDVAWFAPPPVEEKPDVQRRNVQNKAQ
jgi:hypothetical protein